MKKLKLDLSALKVESFETTEPGTIVARGTVVAQSWGCTYTENNCTVDWTTCPSDWGDCVTECTQIASTCFTSCNSEVSNTAMSCDTQCGGCSLTGCVGC